MGWLRQLFSRSRRYDELSESIREHLDEKITDLMDHGMTREQAQRSARIEFGNVARIEERSREVWQWPTLESIWADLLHAFRHVRRETTSSVIVVLTLALGIGTNIAIFTVFRAVLIKPLPMPHPERITMLWETIPPAGYGTVSWPDLKDWKAQNHAFSAIASYQSSNFNLGKPGGEIRVPGATVSGDFFSVMGVQPLLGGFFSGDENGTAKNDVIVIGETLWKNNFQSNPNVVGTEAYVDGRKVTIAGVIPSTLRFPSQDTEVWAPLSPDATWTRGEHNLFVVGRLRPGVDIHRASAELNVIAKNLQSQYIEDKGRGVLLVPLQEQLVRSVREPLSAMMILAFCVFLIACTNVTNLLLGRAVSRRPEVAIRAALGASRSQIVRQFLAENLLLATLSGVVGWFAALGTVRVLIAMSPTNLPRIHEIAPDRDVFLFALACTLFAALMLGMATGLTAVSADLQSLLREYGRFLSISIRQKYSQNAIVIVQVAMAFTLLSCAGLVLISFVRIASVNPGFNPSGVLALRVSLPDWKYLENRPRSQFYDAVLAKTSQVPGVVSSGLIAQLPLREYGLSDRFTIICKQIARSATEYIASYRPMSAGYDSTMQIPLIRGRYLSPADTKSTQPVALVNERFVKLFFPDENPIGRSIQVRDEPVTQIVGVVANTHQGGLQYPIDAEIDVPYQQCADQSLVSAMSLAVRTSTPPLGVANVIKHAIYTTDRDAVVFDVETMDDVVARSIGDHRFIAMITTIFAGLALSLAALGMYALMSYAVRRRTHEIGIRMALGATQMMIVRKIVGEGALLTIVGSVVGVGGAVILGRIIASLLFGIQTLAPTMFVLSFVLLIVMSTLVAYIPARRAACINPVETLRIE